MYLQCSDMHLKKQRKLPLRLKIRQGYFWAVAYKSAITCRLHKLKQKHQQMQSVVQRAAQAPTEQVSWDDDETEPTPELSSTTKTGTHTQLIVVFSSHFSEPSLLTCCFCLMTSRQSTKPENSSLEVEVQRAVRLPFVKILAARQRGISWLLRRHC